MSNHILDNLMVLKMVTLIFLFLRNIILLSEMVTWSECRILSLIRKFLLKRVVIASTVTIFFRIPRMATFF